MRSVVNSWQFTKSEQYKSVSANNKIFKLQPPKSELEAFGKAHSHFHSVYESKEEKLFFAVSTHSLARNHDSTQVEETLSSLWGLHVICINFSQWMMAFDSLYSPQNCPAHTVNKNNVD